MRKTGKFLICQRCGAEYYRANWQIERGDSKFCTRRCQNRTQAEKKPNLKHGLFSNGKMTQEYRAYHSMIDRCYNPNCTRYHDWGGRGIRVCKRWLKGEGELSGLECFLQDMGPKPTSGHVFDRHPDMNGNYEPDNCRWATKEESTQNRRFTPKWQQALARHNNTPKHRAHMQQLAKNHPNRMEGYIDSRFINNGKIQKMLKTNQILPKGWTFGRLKLKERE